MSRFGCIAILVAFVVAGCGGGSGKRNPVADCGMRGVQSVRVDNYGGGGTGREVIICRDGQVFVDG